MSLHAECCDERCVHKEIVEHVLAHQPDEDALYDLAELFKVFGDSTRVRILYALIDEELCVCDLSEALDMTQSAISHQLQILRTSKLVKSRREGKQIYYSLADAHVVTIMAQGLDHILE